MHAKTIKLKKTVEALSNTRDKLSAMQDYYKGEDALLFSCGPSFCPDMLRQMNGLLEGHLVISIKQAFNELRDITDFHLYNWINLQKYNYPDHVFAVGENAYPYGKGLLIGRKPSLELVLSKDAYLNSTDPNRWLINTRDYDRHRLSVNPERPLGPGIMIEVALYLLLHLGVTNVYCIGWDVSAPPDRGDKNFHFYDNKVPTIKRNRFRYASKLGSLNPLSWEYVKSIRHKVKYWRGDIINIPKFLPNENPEVIKGSYSIYEYFLSQGLNTFIVSGNSCLDPRIPRIKMLEIDKHIGPR